MRPSEVNLHSPSFGVVLFFALLGTHSLQASSLDRLGIAELFEISRRARLVKSFEADPGAPVLKLWQQRLGSSEAPDRWAPGLMIRWSCCLAWGMPRASASIR